MTALISSQRFRSWLAVSSVIVLAVALLWCTPDGVHVANRQPFVADVKGFRQTASAAPVSFLPDCQTFLHRLWHMRRGRRLPCDMNTQAMQSPCSQASIAPAPLRRLTPDGSDLQATAVLLFGCTPDGVHFTDDSCCPCRVALTSMFAPKNIEFDNAPNLEYRQT